MFILLTIFYYKNVFFSVFTIQVYFNVNKTRQKVPGPGPRLLRLQNIST